MAGIKLFELSFCLFCTFYSLHQKWDELSNRRVPLSRIRGGPEPFIMDKFVKYSESRESFIFSRNISHIFVHLTLKFE